ncbi:hypothetical protein B0T24DRAFT_17811 [Lasiosphaeria ovina]|uniref:Uncharacterized protein n=1 Tax=Lasiosphaeria ovina TaxID=92902 RepID=A0AAE0TWZ8_9PEZI|nr:hypothetical protein B0T24DRAFT_17811 [Lasiosphaeria ovina]
MQQLEGCPSDGIYGHDANQPVSAPLHGIQHSTLVRGSTAEAVRPHSKASDALVLHLRGHGDICTERFTGKGRNGVLESSDSTHLLRFRWSPGIAVAGLLRYPKCLIPRQSCGAMSGTAEKRPVPVPPAAVLFVTSTLAKSARDNWCSVRTTLPIWSLPSVMTTQSMMSPSLAGSPGQSSHGIPGGEVLLVEAWRATIVSSID